MKKALAALFIVAFSAEAQTALKLTVDDLRRDGEWTKVVVRVTNGSSQRYRSVFVSCAFIARSKAIGTSDALLSNIEPGQTAFETTALRQTGVEDVQCRISQAHPG